MAQPSLAIVIPCYKGRYFRETLQSIANQTNRNYNLYIGIDASPDNIEKIISEVNFENQIVVKRFENNLGSISIVKAWERCIDLTNEDYIWIFSDDDLMPVDAVDRFYLNIKQSLQFDLFRFPLQIIDQNNTVIKFNQNNESILTAEEFLINKLLGKLDSAVIEYIFKRTHFLAENRFIDFPVAWCSDDATWAKLGKKNNIKLISGSPVSWRNVENYNISNSNKFNSEKICATNLFINWIADNFNNHNNFKYPVYKYIKNIFTCSLRYNFSHSELVRICFSVKRFSYFFAVRLYFKFLFKRKS